MSAPQTYSLFYRRYGVRLVNQLQAPILHDLKLFQLPQGAIYHYASYTGIELGPAVDDIGFRGQTRPILVENISTPHEFKGSMRKVITTDTDLVKDLRIQNRRLRIMRDLESAFRDELALITINYSFIPKCYKYTRTLFTEYFKWYNIFSTVTMKMADLASQTSRPQFYFCGIPPLLPNVSLLDAAQQELSQSQLKLIREPHGFILLELWKWLGESRNLSLFSRIPLDKLHHINLVFQENTKWCVINLGVLNGFRKPVDGEAILKDEKGEGHMAPAAVQKRFLAFCMRMMEARTMTANTDDGLDEPAVEQEGAVGTGEAGEETQTSGTLSKKVEVTEASGAQDEATVLEDEEVPEESEHAKAARLEQEEIELNLELAKLNDIAQRQESESKSEHSSIEDLLAATNSDPGAGVMRVCDKLANEGLLTAAEYRRFEKLSNWSKTAPNPYRKGAQTNEEFRKVDPASLVIRKRQQFVKTNTVFDDTMLSSVLEDFNAKYVEEVLPRHLTDMVANVQNAGIAVTGHEVEEVTDILGAYEVHSVRLNPVVGAQTSIVFRVPKVEPDGSWKSNGVTYKLKKLRGDLPIRKVKYNKVALTSYYGKAFVTRGGKAQHDHGRWLQNQLMQKGLSKTDEVITQIWPADVSDQTLKAPRNYTALAQGFKAVIARGYHVYFSQRDVVASVEPSRLQQFANETSLVIGQSNTGLLVLDQFGSVYTTLDNKLIPFGTLEAFLGIDTTNSPVEYAAIGVYAKDVPVGVMLSYYYGLSELMKLLKVEPRRVEAGQRLNLTPDEYVIAFADETLIFSRDDRLASLILGGFNEYHKTIKLFSVYSFDAPGVYLNLLDSAGLGVRHLREMDLMDQMFIDPITKSILEKMKEPQTFKGLLIRAAELLLVDQHPDELDPAYMRDKGYERIAGAVYAELVQSIRNHNALAGKSNKKIDHNPYAVWKRIVEDPSKMLVNEINPIMELKEAEAVTYSGTGGRNKRSMTKATRAYHPNDMGVISESTVDSSDTAINVFTSASPNYDSLLGTSTRYDPAKDGASSLISTSALLAANSDRDDARRVAFVSIQQQHTISCDGYQQQIVRTGYESIVGQRTSDLYCLTAKQPGKVIKLDARGIVVEYADGSKKGHKLGRRFGSSAGLTIPHEIATQLKVGDSFEVGEAIVYNTGCFEPDFLNPKMVTFKNSFYVKTALWESSQTLDDASSISKRVSAKLSTQVTKIKHVVVSFEKAITNMVKPGQGVDYDTPLCYIEDAFSANAKLFDETSISSLKEISTQAPKAGVKGVVEAVEVYYHGDVEDMSGSLIHYAQLSDKWLKEKARSANQAAYTGQVDSGYRIEGEPLGFQCVALKFYITTQSVPGIGDKGVFANQLKTVFSEIMEDDYVTENGETVDAIFGYVSVDNRVVNSAIDNGTTASLVKHASKKMAQIYRSGKKG